MLKEMKMSNNTQPEFDRPLVPTTGMRGEIARRWGKFSDQEIADLKDKDDLVDSRSKAQRDVDAFGGSSSRT